MPVKEILDCDNSNESLHLFFTVVPLFAFVIFELFEGCTYLWVEAQTRAALARQSSLVN